MNQAQPAGEAFINAETGEPMAGQEPTPAHVQEAIPDHGQGLAKASKKRSVAEALLEPPDDTPVPKAPAVQEKLDKWMWPGLHPELLSGIAAVPPSEEEVANTMAVKAQTDASGDPNIFWRFFDSSPLLEPLHGPEDFRILSTIRSFRYVMEVEHMTEPLSLISFGIAPDVRQCWFGDVLKPGLCRRGFENMFVIMQGRADLLLDVAKAGHGECTALWRSTLMPGVIWSSILMDADDMSELSFLFLVTGRQQAPVAVPVNFLAP
jgi:hypothetical protein